MPISKSLLVLLFLAVPILAVAESSLEIEARQAANQCNTGVLLCCNQTEDSSSNIGLTILKIFGIPAGSVTGLIGLTCSPITVIGAGSNQCSAIPVCCTNNNFNGVIALGCTPFNQNL